MLEVSLSMDWSGFGDLGCAQPGVRQLDVDESNRQRSFEIENVRDFARRVMDQGLMGQAVDGDDGDA